MRIPSPLLHQFYAFGSLASGDHAFHFDLVNRLGPAALTRVLRLAVDGEALPLDDLVLQLDGDEPRPVAMVRPERPAVFPVGQRARVRAAGQQLAPGGHVLTIAIETAPYGVLELEVEDRVAGPALPPGSGPGPGPVPGTGPDPGPDPGPASGAASAPPHPAHIPHDRDPARDYTPAQVAERRRFVEAFAGVTLHHVAQPSFDPATVRGNIENLTGVAQVPLGFAGPLRVNGEHARGDFLIPLATTEGTLVASYSRGMKVLNLSGGVTCTVSADAMQRAPVFEFDSAREARDFRAWLEEHLPQIRLAAESTSRVARLLHVDTFLASRFAYSRFSFATGDAAGQNMVGKATLAACEWILSHARGVRRFYLESNLATDKKPSHVNVLRSRGKHVTAEATIPRAVLATHLRVAPEQLVEHWGIAGVGAFLAGVNNNGLHAPNAITAIFIATGQDVANVTEASSAVCYTEVTTGGDLYLSLTIPSLIVATHGGGTGLATQRECLAVLGCVGAGKARKLAEIVAGAALAGEISLAAAISANEWVSAHERFGRKR